MELKFTKMHAYGNDYVYIDAINQNINKINLSKLATDLSNRNFFIGSDGIVLILPSKTCDFRMQMFNSDGSEGSMCGNALRCVTKYVYEHGLTDKTELKIETLGGFMQTKIFFKENIISNIKSNIGKPVFECEKVPVLSNNKTFMSEKVEVLDKIFLVSCVNVGNPHAVIFVNDVLNFDVKKYGNALEMNENLFPDRVNVSFAEIVNDSYIKIRVWERGSGETIGCATGCSATAVIAMMQGLCKRTVELEQIGGNLSVEWDEKTDEISIIGEACEVFNGEIKIKT